MHSRTIEFKLVRTYKVQTLDWRGWTASINKHDHSSKPNEMLQNWFVGRNHLNIHWMSVYFIECSSWGSTLFSAIQWILVKCENYIYTYEYSSLFIRIQGVNARWCKSISKLFEMKINYIFEPTTKCRQDSFCFAHSNCELVGAVKKNRSVFSFLVIVRYMNRKRMNKNERKIHHIDASKNRKIKPKTTR